MRKVFGVHQETHAKGQLRPEVIRDLTAIGYPGFYQATAFLTREGRARWEAERLLLFPTECCVCRAPAELVLKTRNAASNFFGLRRSTLSGVPHCRAHADFGHARLLAGAEDLGHRYMSVTLVAASRAFLENTLALCSEDGLYEPPWIVFPGKSPHIGWNQGTESAWRQLAWEPFWQNLTDRDSYIKDWHAPAEWERYLSDQR